MHVLNVNAKCNVFSIYESAFLLVLLCIINIFHIYDAMYCICTLCKCMHVGGAACTVHAYTQHNVNLFKQCLEVCIHSLFRVD